MGTTAVVQSDIRIKDRTLLPKMPIVVEQEHIVPDKTTTPWDPYLPRENIAPTKESPYGTVKDDYAEKNKKKTVLEQHVAFFDRDGDGVIWPTDTWATCRGFGWSMPLTLFFTVFLHAVQSWGTVPWFWLIPDPLFRVWVHNIFNNKHGSSTMAFDTEGRFRPHLFEEFFAKFDPDKKGGLTFKEGLTGLRKHKMAWDIFGQISDMFEWGMTYVLLWPEDGVVKKEDARRVMDGSIFHDMTMKHSRSTGVNGR